MDVRHDTLELARFLTELSVIDYFFVMHRPSSVGLAALLNSLSIVSGVSESARDDFEREVNRIPGLSPSHPDVEECRNRLSLLYAQGGYCRNGQPGEETRNETISPVCVSYGVKPQHYAASQPSERAPFNDPKHQQTFSFSHSGMEDIPADEALLDRGV